MNATLSKLEEVSLTRREYWEYDDEIIADTYVRTEYCTAVEIHDMLPSTDISVLGAFEDEVLHLHPNKHELLPEPLLFAVYEYVNNLIKRNLIHEVVVHGDISLNDLPIKSERIRLDVNWDREFSYPYVGITGSSGNYLFRFLYDVEKKHALVENVSVGYDLFKEHGNVFELDLYSLYEIDGENEFPIQINQ